MFLNSSFFRKVLAVALICGGFIILSIQKAEIELGQREVYTLKRKLRNEYNLMKCEQLQLEMMKNKITFGGEYVKPKTYYQAATRLLP